MSSSEPIRVVLDRDIEFSRRDYGGRTTMVAQQRATGKFFQFGAEEHRIACLLDGRPIPELMEQLAKEGIHWKPEEVAEFVSRLVQSKLATPIGASSGPDGTPSKAAMPWSQRIPAVMSLVISQRIPLLQGDGIASRLEKVFGGLFAVPGLLAWCVLALSGFVIVMANRQHFAEELRRMFDPGIWLILIVLWIVAKVIHEMGHAIAAKHHGVRIGKIGIMFFLCAPLAYVDVTDAWRVKSRLKRVQIALGGVYVELAAAALAAWAWWFLPAGMAKHLAAQFVLIAGPATLFVNANPLLRLDGYYVLSDLTEIPNLRMHGRRQLSGWVNWLLLRDEPARPLLSGWRRPFATVHAFCSVVFQVVWMSGLVVGVTLWAKGLGVVIACVAVMLWAVFPLGRWCWRVWKSDQPTFWIFGPRRNRLLFIASVVALLIQYFNTCDSPFDRRVPVVVQFSDEQISRSPVDAFVRRVYVESGDRVETGTLLVELNAPELHLERSRKADELKIAELQAIQLRRQGELANSAAAAERAASMQRQLDELDQKVQGLQVRAEREGLVLLPLFDSIEGRFYKKGDELLRVSDPGEKELLASVSERDMQAYQEAAASGKPASVRLRGGEKLTTVPAPLRPSARRTLAHPALAATAGGPLAVEPSPNENQPIRTAEPQLESVIKLDPVASVEVHAGQIGMMTIADDRTLVTRVLENLKR